MEKNEKKRAVIMAGADISDYSFYTPLSGDYVICADRGYLHARKLGIIPDILLGDFDSLSMPLPKETKVQTYPAEKDETDSQIAIGHALSRGLRDIYIIGAFGGRTDHFLGNVCLMKWAKDRGGHILMEDNDTSMRLLSGDIVLPCRKNFYLSVIPFFGDAVVSISGVKYPLCEKYMPLGDTLGLSNEITENEARISVHQGMALILQCRADKELLEIRSAQHVEA